MRNIFKMTILFFCVTIIISSCGTDSSKGGKLKEEDCCFEKLLALDKFDYFVGRDEYYSHILMVFNNGEVWTANIETAEDSIEFDELREKMDNSAWQLICNQNFMGRFENDFWEDLKNNIEMIGINNQYEYNSEFYSYDLGGPYFFTSYFYLWDNNILNEILYRHSTSPRFLARIENETATEAFYKIYDSDVCAEWFRNETDITWQWEKWPKMDCLL